MDLNRDEENNTTNTLVTSIATDTAITTPAPVPAIATAALILDSIPAQSLAGIDLLSFTTSSRFRGVRQIPPGWHFVFVAAAATSPTISSTSSTAKQEVKSGALGFLSVRQGVWFHVPSTPLSSSSSSSQDAFTLTVLKWDPNNEVLLSETDDLALMRWRANLGAVWKEGLTPYRQRGSSPPPSLPLSSDSLPYTSRHPREPFARIVDADLDDDFDDRQGVDDEDDENEDEHEDYGNLDNADWPFLTSHITPQILSRILPQIESPSSSPTTITTWRLASTSSSIIDIDAMNALVTEKSPSSQTHKKSIKTFITSNIYNNPPQNKTEGDDPILHFLPIDLRQTWAPGTTGRARSTAAQDRTWALNHLVETHCSGEIAQILGELEFCFVMTATLSNASCAEQWIRILRLVLTCVEATRSSSGNSHADFFVRLLAILKRQIAVARNKASDDVLELLELLEQDGSEVKSLLVRFRKNVDMLLRDNSNNDNNHSFSSSPTKRREEEGKGLQMVKKELSRLENFLRRECGWELDNKNLTRSANNAAAEAAAAAAGGSTIGLMDFLDQDGNTRSNHDRTDPGQTLAAIVDINKSGRGDGDDDEDEEDEEIGEFAPTVVDLTEEQAKLLGIDRVTISGRGRSTLEQTLLHEEEEEEAKRSEADEHHESDDNEEMADEEEDGNDDDEDDQELEDMDERF